MNIVKNSNESVLVGVLRLYRGCRGKDDRLLLDVMRHIDETRSLTIFSSSETWNAFKTNLPRVNIEPNSSSLLSPFSIMDPNITRNNIAAFDVSVPETEETAIEYLQKMDTTYDPNFWLPIIAYCLEKVTHSSDIVLLIENSSIGYALVCLSSMDEMIRKMASTVLIRWEELSQVSSAEWVAHPGS